jgi:hypothetical protein
VGYNELIKQHLADYKIKALGINRNGLWKRNNKPYAHILPKERGILNILSAYSEDFCDYLDTYGIKLHQDFHHLNSSQAMCFNLFFPFMFENKLEVLAHEVLSLPDAEIMSAEFEKVLDQTEATNFDFFMEMSSSGARIFCEIKLSEGDFGTAFPDARHSRKLQDIYRPRLLGKVMPKYLDEELFFKHYQVLRNISYLRKDGMDILFLIFPRGNEKLAATEQIIRDMMTKGFKDKVSILYLEDVVEKILQAVAARNARLVQHYVEFKKKYIPECSS